MLSESNDTDNRDRPEGPDLTGPDEPQAHSGSGRWFLIAVVVVLVVYPAARWVLSRGGGTTAGTPASTAGAAELQLSFSHYQAGRYDDAVAAAKAAIAANANNADAYNNLAVSYMGLHKVDDAIQAVQEAIRLRPDYQLAKNNLAWFQQEKVKATLPAVPPSQAAQAGALLNQSLDHAQARRYKECVETATQATKLDPGSSRAFNNLGFCQAVLQQWDPALKSIQEAIRLEPGLQLARNNLAWIQGEKAKADAAKAK